jgi:hypothetical protein
MLLPAQTSILTLKHMLFSMTVLYRFQQICICSKLSGAVLAAG